MFYFVLTGHANVRELLLDITSPGEEHPRMQAAWCPAGRELSGTSTPVLGRAPLSPAQEQIKALGIYLLAGCGTLALSDRAFHPY